MRILLYIYGRLTGEQLFCRCVKAAHRRDIQGLFYCMQYRHRYGRFIPAQIDIFERILDGK